MKLQMLFDCQWVVKLYPLLPQDYEFKPENKAFLYAAVAAGFQRLAIWGRSLHPTHTDIIQCTPRVRQIGTEELLNTQTLIPRRDPFNLGNLMVDIVAAYGHRWYFCHPTIY